MGRLTTDKNVLEMSMVELAHNSCYAEEGRARYRDYETDMDARELAKKLLAGYADMQEEFADDEEFDEYMENYLEYGIDYLRNKSQSGIKVLIASFYTNLWAMADLRERLKAYEDIGLTPEQLREVDRLYAEKCRELADAQRTLSLRIKEGKVKKDVSMSEAEMEVMEKLWGSGRGIRQSQLLTILEADGKTWKRQTLNTFLSRLENKGLVKRENRLVEPVYSREEYANIQVKATIDRMYGGKLSDFIAAFVKENAGEKGINGLAHFIADLVFAEKETVLEALENNDKQVLEDELYYAIQSCEAEVKE